MANLDPNRLKNLHRYWQAANYLTNGQIYLQDNPLLRESLRPGHIKPGLLGHWGTSPGLSFLYVHLDRLIQDTGANAIYLTGPGHALLTSSRTSEQCENHPRRKGPSCRWQIPPSNRCQ